MTARAHAAAIGVLLAADTGLVSYDGEVPVDPPARYVVFYVTLPLGRNPRLGGVMGRQHVTVSTLHVGNTPNEVRWVAEHTQAALTLKRPAVTNRTTSPLVLGTAGQVRPDDSIAPPAWVATDVWSFASTGAH